MLDDLSNSKNELKAQNKTLENKDYETIGIQNMDQ